MEAHVDYLKGEGIFSGSDSNSDLHTAWSSLFPVTAPSLNDFVLQGTQNC